MRARKTTKFLFMAFLFCSAAGFPQQSAVARSGTDSSDSRATQSGATKAASVPYTPGLDVSAMDKMVDPCVDFYAYSCGGWQKQNPIPADQAS